MNEPEETKREEKKPTARNVCVCCGAEIPEGRQVCPLCEISGNGYQYRPPKKRWRDKFREIIQIMKG